jgi:hypothetical protein
MLLTVFMSVLVGCNKKEEPQLEKAQIENTQAVLETGKEITQGDFIYRLVTEKVEYIENGPVKIYAELEYIGDKEEIEIFHAASPFYFPMVEKTRDFQIDYSMNQPLVSTTLIKGVPLIEHYAANGGYNSEDAEEYISFMKRIMKSEFPVGDYVVNGAADFFVITNEDTREKREYNIIDQIEFKVNHK